MRNFWLGMGIKVKERQKPEKSVIKRGKIAVKWLWEGAWGSMPNPSLCFFYWDGSLKRIFLRMTTLPLIGSPWKAVLKDNTPKKWFPSLESQLQLWISCMSVSIGRNMITSESGTQCVHLKMTRRIIVCNLHVNQQAFLPLSLPLSMAGKVQTSSLWKENDWWNINKDY